MTKKNKNNEDGANDKAPEVKDGLTKKASKALTPKDRGAEYLNQHPRLGFDSVLITSDNAVFLPTLQGENSALNHSKGLSDQTIITVNRGDETE